MSRYDIMYIGNTYRDEENYLKTNNIQTYRADEFEQLTNLPTNKKYIIRGKKMTLKSYSNMYHFFKDKGITLVSSPKSYEIAGSAKLNSQLLGSVAPSVYTYPSSMNNTRIIQCINEAKATPPLFVRSEKESAAKYVGVDGCIIKEGTYKEFQTSIDNLRNNVLYFDEIIFKQVFSIKSTVNGEKLEYRAIIIEGMLISFDYDSVLPTPKSIGLDSFVIEIANDLKHKGFDGGYFMDFAVKDDNSFFVVECKDLINGTIKDISAFSQGLK